MRRLTQIRCFKTHLYEGGIRSSLIASGPGLITRKNHVDRKSVFSAIDLVATLLDLTGTTWPEGVKLDGESLPNALLGKGDSRRAQIFFRRPPDRDSFYGEKAARSGRARWQMEIRV